MLYMESAFLHARLKSSVNLCVKHARTRPGAMKQHPGTVCGNSLEASQWGLPQLDHPWTSSMRWVFVITHRTYWHRVHKTYNISFRINLSDLPAMHEAVFCITDAKRPWNLLHWTRPSHCIRLGKDVWFKARNLRLEIIVCHLYFCRMLAILHRWMMFIITIECSQCERAHHWYTIQWSSMGPRPMIRCLYAGVDRLHFPVQC